MVIHKGANGYHLYWQTQGKFYLSVDPSGEGARWRRTIGQEIYSPLLLAFSEEEVQSISLIVVPANQLKGIFVFILLLVNIEWNEVDN